MTQELRDGDVVRLKSGGPPMTIEKIGKFGYEKEVRAMCVWFDGKQRKAELFVLTSLEKAEPPKASFKAI